MKIGEQIIDFIASNDLMRVECVLCNDGTRAHVFVWSSGAAEQLEAKIAALMAEAMAEGLR